MSTQPSSASTSVLQTQQYIHRLPSQSLSQLLSNQSTGSPISTSIGSFDHALDGGFQPAQIYEVCGISGSGKTSLASQLCINCLKNDKKVLWISTLQYISLDKVKNYFKENTELLKSVDTIRLTTLGSLFLFLQSLSLRVKKYSLIIIDDFATCIKRCFDDNEQSVNSTRPKNKHISLESKKNRSIQSILKVLSAYCATNNSSCVLFNSSNILNMSFVEIQKSSELAQNPQYPSSQPFSSQSFTSKPSKPKRLYQQVLVSPLGDHPFWSSYFNSRIMLYRDWSSSTFVAAHGGQSTSIFVHIRQSSSLKKQKSQPVLKPYEVITFQETNHGITEISKDEISMISNTSLSFTLEEEDFDSDNEAEGESEASITNEPRTTDMNGTPIILGSSPRQLEISTAKNILSDGLTNELATDRGFQNNSNGSNEGPIRDELRENEGETSHKQYEHCIARDQDAIQEYTQSSIAEEEEEEEAELAIDDTTDIEVQVEAHQEEEGKLEIETDHEAQGANHTLEVYTETVPKMREKVSIIEFNEPTEDENESSLIQLSDHEFQTEKPTDNERGNIVNFTSQVAPLQAKNEIEEPQVSEMVQDVSLEDIEEIEEIEDELEELYPTQPESLSVIQLSQLQQPEPRLKRYNSPPLVSKYLKRLRGLPLQDCTNDPSFDYHSESNDSQIPSDEYIPASAPYF